MNAVEVQAARGRVEGNREHDRNAALRNHAVAIAGGGPTGLMLAAELALAGVDVAVVERRGSQELVGSRVGGAGGLHARSIEILDQRGIAERFLIAGRRYPVVHFHVALDMSDLPTRHNYVLGLSQDHIERILAERADELAVPIYRGCEVAGFTQDDAGVDIALSDGRSLRSEYLVGCDGGRSLIRKAAGIAFPGWDPTTSWLIAEVEMAQEPKLGFHRDANGIHAIARVEDSASFRVVLTEGQLQLDREPVLNDVRAALVASYGTDFGIRGAGWISRFTDVTRQAAAYRDGRVLLAGDAAHVHPPVGGQGLNIGIQDAMNLGWKLAQVIKHTSPQHLLDSYQAERHPVAARVLRNTMAQIALRRMDERSMALGDAVTELLKMDEPRKRIAAMMSALDVGYDLGEGHPLLGRRMPDLDMRTESGPRRTFTFLHKGVPTLFNLAKPGSLDISPWGDRVQLVDAACDAAWELPVVGIVAAPDAVLVRPDGHVAWAGSASKRSLSEVLTDWFGPPIMQG